MSKNMQIFGARKRRQGKTPVNGWGTRPYMKPNKHRMPYQSMPGSKEPMNMSFLKAQFMNAMDKLRGKVATPQLEQYKTNKKAA